MLRILGKDQKQVESNTKQDGILKPLLSMKLAIEYQVYGYLSSSACVGA